MNKKLVINLLKYALAVGLLGWVIWSNWGSPDRVASVIADESTTEEQTEHSGTPALVGTITSYDEGQSLTVAPVNDASPKRWTFLITKKTKLTAANDDVPLRDGATVAIWEAPRGLAYVWRHHLVTGEEKINVGIFFVALVIGAIAILITLVRWWVLVRAQNIPLPLSDAIRLGSVGIFFNTFLPGSVGGDIIKAAFIARERKDQRATAVATVLLDRGIALWGLICFMVLAGTFFWAVGQLDNRAAQRIVIVAAILVGVSLLGWFLMGLLPEWRARKFAGRLARWPKVGHAFSEIWNAVWIYRCRQRTVALAIGLSWIAHLGFLFTFFCCARTLFSAGEVPSLGEHYVLLPIGMVIEAIPLFPGGAGIGELGYGGLYQLFGFAAANGVLMSLMQRVIKWIIGGFCYIMYLRMKPAIKVTLQETRAINEAPPLPKKIAC